MILIKKSLTSSNRGFREIYRLAKSLLFQKLDLTEEELVQLQWLRIEKMLLELTKRLQEDKEKEE
ncbi:hypothetical protein [Oribacterium sinus]|uniref:hypothetical protein n=1 Tax=Oribacterium sinus TaxID=237576 RepID=UPI0028EF0C98|nr:hypothetical protein [Oribacterium sinus]